MIGTGNLALATAQYSVACEVARQTTNTFEDALYHVRMVWPKDADPFPTTREGWVDALAEITTKAVVRSEKAKGVWDS